MSVFKIKRGSFSQHYEFDSESNKQIQNNRQMTKLESSHKVIKNSSHQGIGY